MYLVFLSMLLSVVSVMFWPPKVSYLLWFVSLSVAVVVYLLHATSTLSINL